MRPVHKDLKSCMEPSSSLPVVHYIDETGKPEDAEASALRNAFWAYIVRNVPPRFRQGIRTGDVFDFMARFTDTYLIRRTIDIRSTRRE